MSAQITAELTAFLETLQIADINGELFLGVQADNRNQVVKLPHAMHDHVRRWHDAKVQLQQRAMQVRPFNPIPAE